MLMYYNNDNPTTSSSSSTTASETRDDIPVVHTDSNSSLSDRGIGEDEGKVVYDSTTDLAYHDSSEREGAELIRRALTPEEESAMPDNFMPLRHYRAEKVG